MSVEKVNRKGGAVWRVRWRDASGQAHSKVLGRKRDAEMFDAEIKRRKRIGDLATLDGGKRDAGRVRRGAGWKIYAEPNLAASTLKRSYAGHVGHGTCSPRLGALRLRETCGPKWSAASRLELRRPTALASRLDLQGARCCCRASCSARVEWDRLAVQPGACGAQAGQPRAPARSVPLAPRRRRGGSARSAARQGQAVRDATLVSACWPTPGCGLAESAGADAGIATSASARCWSRRAAEHRRDRARRRAPAGARTVRLLAPLAADLAEWRLACGRRPTRRCVFPGRRRPAVVATAT